MYDIGEINDMEYGFDCDNHISSDDLAIDVNFDKVVMCATILTGATLGAVKGYTEGINDPYISQAASVYQGTQGAIYGAALGLGASLARKYAPDIIEKGKELSQSLKDEGLNINFH